MASFKFSDKDKERIKAAVADLESASSGEVVPYIVERSDDYSEAPWLMAAITGILVLVTEAILAFTWSLPSMSDPVFLAITTVALMAIGFTLTFFIYPLRTYLVSDLKKNERVFQRAKISFLEEEVFGTNERIGILIFISHLEHQVVVLGDAGINAKVKPEDWQHVVDHILQGIKTKQITDGIVKAIESCKELLLENGFNTRSDGTNELSDDLRIG